MKQNIMLFIRKIFISFLLITFFCMFSRNVYAASFNYAQFDWDTFLEEHSKFWVDSCEPDDQKCIDQVLKTKEKFYVRLYKLLTQFQNKGFILDDNIIIATVFFGLTPDSFKDKESEEDIGVYNIDEDEFNSGIFKYIANDPVDENAKEYFKKETDSLKTLMNNMLSYTQLCYGVTDDTVTKEDDGSYTCSGDESVYYDGDCVVNLKKMSATYWDRLGLLKVFGKTNDNELECQQLSKNYKNYKLSKTSDRPEIDYDFYWDFLLHSEYFDTKDHLQSFYSIVLAETNKTSMKEVLEDETLVIKYQKDIEDARQHIIDLIKDIINTYGETSQVSLSYKSASSTSYWFPIGSDEVTAGNGLIMAVGEPASLNITSNFGKRTSPKTGMHYGVDIAGVTGVTNVVAVRDGVVVKSTFSNGISCQDLSDINNTCGGKYGNHVIIQHSDGNYTLYAHLAEGSLTLKVGDSVAQGQVIGKVGSSGSSTGGHLHFEVRVGGIDAVNATDPLTYISVENPRASSATSDLIEFLHSWEGAPKESGEYYIAFDDGYGTTTIGWGIVPKYNLDRFTALGIDGSSIGVGTKVQKSIVDTVEQQEIQSGLDSINAMLSNANISLSQNQIDALVSRKYNYNVNGFVEAYSKYGDNDNLYTNYMAKPITSQGKVSKGLVRRREAEWNLFHNGVYQLN